MTTLNSRRRLQPFLHVSFAHKGHLGSVRIGIQPNSNPRIPDAFKKAKNNNYRNSYCTLGSVLSPPKSSATSPPDDRLLLFHFYSPKLHICYVFSQIPGGDKAVLCCSTRDPKTRKKGEPASINAFGFDAKNKPRTLWSFYLSLTFLVQQIQFREKVLWTAITLFIFLVCCQVCVHIYSPMCCNDVKNQLMIQLPPFPLQ